MTTDLEVTSPPANQKKLLYLLIGSLVLNAFLLGVISVHVVSRRAGFGGRGPNRPDVAMDAMGERGGQRLFRQLVRAAGGPGDPRVRQLWSGRRGHLGEVRKALSASREQVLVALEREPFDKQELERALVAAEQARQRADHVATEGVLDLAAQLTPEERKTLRSDTNTPNGARGGQRRFRD